MLYKENWRLKVLFSSISFLYYFLPITLILYFLAKNKYRNIILLLASLFFYFYGEPKYTLLMLISAFSAYIHGMLIYKFRETKYSKITLIDLRYINNTQFEKLIKIKENSDVLFMYNTSILNNSSIITKFFIFTIKI